jgi:ribosomal protein S18 acetylase RimI-like enzyme
MWPGRSPVGARAGYAHPVRLRRPDDRDYDLVIGAVDGWWGGRSIVPMLPRLFFTHFAGTSLVAESDDGTLLGFLVGFHSPSRPGEAYVHVIGVDPAARGGGVGAALHAAFADEARAAGCGSVALVTSPTNAASLAFHQGLGFHPQHGPAERDGLPYRPAYDGPDGDRVLLVRAL